MARSVLQVWLGRPDDEPRAWFLLGANLFALPGAGSFLAGRRAAGVAQAMVATAGAAMTVVWLADFFGQWAAEGMIPLGPGEKAGWAFGGIAVFAGAWLWSLQTGLDVLRETRRHAEARREPR